MSSTTAVTLYPSAMPAASSGLYPSAVEPSPVGLRVEQHIAPAAVDVPSTIDEIARQSAALLSDVRRHEPPGAGWLDFARAFPTRMAADVLAEVKDAIRAAVALRVGFSQVAAVVRIASVCERRSANPITNEQALEVLRARWGDDADANLALAKSMARRITKRWPGFAEFLEVNRVGSHPALVELLYLKAKHDAARR